MAVDHPGSAFQEVQRQAREARRQAKATLQNSSIGRALVRFYAGGGVLIEDGGGINITGGGYLNITGDLTGAGDFDWTGPWRLAGAGQVTSSNVAWTGVLNLTGTMNVNGAGRVVVGPVIIDRNGSYGGRIVSTGTLLLDASTAVVLGAATTVQGAVTAVGLISGTSIQSLSNITALGNITAVGDIGGGSKSFWIDHPTKAGKQLRHGSLEGPEHGVYYRGVVEFDATGEAVFELPGYFSALVLADDDPTVQVTAIGRPFATGAERVADGRLTIYGDPGREAHVTVTAARERFDVEPDKATTEPIASDWTSPDPEEES